MKIGDLHPEDVRTGMFIVVTGTKQKYFHPDFPHEEMKARWDGSPLKVLGVCFPFVAVWNGRMRFALDVREIILQQVHWRYANVFYKGDVDITQIAPSEEKNLNSIPKVIRAPTPKSQQRIDETPKKRRKRHDGQDPVSAT